MSESMDCGPLLEGVFAVVKPSNVSTPQVLLDLQAIFVGSTTFAPLLADTRRKRAEQESHQPPNQKIKNEEADGRYFKMGHGGTLDPIASGVLIIGIGRGTKQLSTFLGSTKTYETTVVFGMSTDSYDIDGQVTGNAPAGHITDELVKDMLIKFRGPFKQTPPLYSALKINGVKALEYAKNGKEVPRELEAREVHVEQCELVQFLEIAAEDFRRLHDMPRSALLPAAVIKLVVSSGFYVRSFANELGIVCGSLATMATLHRSRQANFIISDAAEAPGLSQAVMYDDLKAGEEAWSPLVAQALHRWMNLNPTRNSQDKWFIGEGMDAAPRQRFRGEWQASTKKDRIKQQGGKFKGKYNQRTKQEDEE
ncbi:tRNA pseudouridine synthase B [Clohesyomyces aquaticus]|uniref:tRNA pseudouridine(55) synthase n=1 Tax=Clohesyomyces aquaticus TaxID=1231657 RepID=A0A1Y1YD01_9PLEO|nr:tRNA pseudouridine synthase B [Clohesyomyces aquaticus]